MKRAIFSMATAFALGFAAVGCDDDWDGPFEIVQADRTGSLTVVTSTFGRFPATAYVDYTYRIDGEGEMEAGSNEANVHQLLPGAYLVEITVPRNCLVQGENPLTANVIEGEDVLVEFEIGCW